MNPKLSTFLALSQTLNYREAAERLYITQPAVTQQIQSLERHYQCKLFHYNGRQLSLTTQGKILLRYAQQEVAREKTLLQALHPPKEIFLSIGATKTVGNYLIHHLLVPFLKTPLNRATVIVENTEVLLDMLHRNLLDFAIIEGAFDKEEYDWKLLKVEPFVGLCSQSHPFAHKTVAIPQLLKETLIIREEGSGTRAILENILFAHNRQTSHFAKSICINDFPLILELVAEKVGVSFAYEMVSKAHPNITTFRLENQSTSHELCFVYLKNTDAMEKIDLFQGDPQPKE